jgi:hypothetical protein
VRQKCRRAESDPSADISRVMAVQRVCCAAVMCYLMVEVRGRAHGPARFRNGAWKVNRCMRLQW